MFPNAKFNINLHFQHLHFQTHFAHSLDRIFYQDRIFSRTVYFTFQDCIFYNIINNPSRLTFSAIVAENYTFFSNIPLFPATFFPIQQHISHFSNILRISATFQGMLLNFFSATCSATWVYPQPSTKQIL